MRNQLTPSNIHRKFQVLGAGSPNEKAYPNCGTTGSTYATVGKESAPYGLSGILPAALPRGPQKRETAEPKLRRFSKMVLYTVL